MVSEKKIYFNFPLYKSMGAIDPWGVDRLNGKILKVSLDITTYYIIDPSD